MEKTLAVYKNYGARTFGSAAATLHLAALGIDSETWNEISQLQRAAWQRLLTLQSDWVRDWMGWLSYSRTIKGANSMSKKVERECNIVAQAVRLVADQATSLVGLLENVEIDYSNLVTEKLDKKRKLPANS